MTTIGAVGGSYTYPANVKRWGDGSVIPTAELKNEDRHAWALALADSYNRSESGQVNPKTAEQVLAEDDESNRMKLQAAQGYERFLAGEATYLGSSRGNKNFWDPAGYQKSLEAARDARYEHYMNMKGPVTIEALNVDSAVSAQGQLTGGDLKNLSTYADYLRNEVAAASQVKSEVSFTGAWGKNVTKDVNEYIGWLMQAAQQKSQAATAEG